MDPIDYSGAFTNVQSPIQAFTQGLQGGAVLQQVQAEQAQQQAAITQRQQMQADLADLSTNPTPDAIARATLKYPQLSEQFKRSLDMLTPEQQKAKIAAAAPVHAAALAGEFDIAAKQLRDHAEALQNSGSEQEAQQTRAMADLIEKHPETATTTTGLLLAAAMSPEKYVEAFKDIGAEGRAAQLQPGAVREAGAKAGAAEADLTLKNLGIVGQTLGSLQGKNAKPEQAKAAIASLVKRGVIAKDEAPDWLGAVPTDPKELDTWLGTMRANGMKPEDQMKYTTPDANAKLQAETSVKTTAMNVAGQQKVQQMISDRQDSKGDAEPTLDADTLTTMAQQYLAGDKSVMQNLGRGAQGAANIVALRKEITAQAKAQGMTGPQIAAAMADYQGMTAGLRTSANISARVENAISEAKELAPLAIEAGRNVARSGFLPFGKAQVMFNTQTNDPAMRKFAAANVGFVTAYAGAMARGQKPTVHDKEHAEKILSEATSQEAYEAAMDQLMLEMAAASRAPENVRGHLRNQIGGKGGHSAAPAAAAAPAIPPGWSVREH